MKRKWKPLRKTIWVIVDMRNQILMPSDIRKCSLEHGAEVPQFAFWGNRHDARWQVNEIKRMMNQECWNTWRLRVVRYDMAKGYW